jgi:hypothetical protein
MVNERVFSTNPKACFTSSMLPSTRNFFIEIVSFCGMDLDGAKGLAMEWIAKGVTLLT